MSRDCCNFIRNTLKIKAIETDKPSEEIKKSPNKMHLLLALPRTYTNPKMY